MNGNDRSIVGLVMLAHGMVHTYELSIPIFVSIWLSEFDVLRVAGVEVAVTQATLGLLVTAGYALFGLGALPGGIVVDRVGSRQLIAACLFGMGGAFLLLGISSSLLVVALALLVWGAAASVYHPAGLTLISKGVSERGTGFAYHGMAGNLGIGLGPLVTTVLLLVLDWTTVALVLAVPAAVAAGEADLALGSDTGGSVRCPAAFTGTVGIKPTYGLVSRYGLIAYANSLEQIGPIAPSVEEAAELLEVIAAPDENDATTRAAHEEIGGENPDDMREYSFADAADGDVDGLEIGVPTELLDGADEDVVETFWDAIDELESQGASYHEVDLPSVEHAVEAYYVIAMSEASSNLARFDGVRYGPAPEYEGNWNEEYAKVREEGFGEEVKRRILLGTYALSAGYHDKYYKKAQDARAWVKQDFDEALEDADVLASPTMPVPPMERGESLDDPLTMYLADANTTPVNLANLPAISVPAGETSDGLPVGLQFIGPAFGERKIIRAGSALA